MIEASFEQGRGRSAAVSGAYQYDTGQRLRMYGLPGPDELAQRDELLLLLGNFPAEIIEERLFAASRAVCRALSLKDESDAALLLSLAIDLAPRVHTACAAGDLSRVFVSFGMPKRRG